MAFVLTGLTLAICCGRDGKLSRLHRHMANHFEALCTATQTRPERVISRAQLPLMLAKVNGEVFTWLLFDWSGMVLREEAKRWFTFDGKELRGSVQPGHSRGEACVSAVAHDSGQVVGQTYYNGTKESERSAVRQPLKDSGLCSRKVTLDALHLTPETTKTIHQAGGIYLISLKVKQAHLYRHYLCNSLLNRATYDRIDKPERGHGRVEERRYACYLLKPDVLAARWRKAGMRACVKLDRGRKGLDGIQISQQDCYYVTNACPTNQEEADELFDAIRRHWLVEVTHYYRDVTLAEDGLKTKSPAISRLVSNLRTLAINLLKRIKPKNMALRLMSLPTISII